MSRLFIQILEVPDEKDPTPDLIMHAEFVKDKGKWIITDEADEDGNCPLREFDYLMRHIKKVVSRT